MKTEKYNKMISAFQCDFSLVRDGEHNFAELDEKLKNPIWNRDLINDIDLLEELEWKLRSGQAEIILKDC